VTIFASGLSGSEYINYGMLYGGGIFLKDIFLPTLPSAGKRY